MAGVGPLPSPGPGFDPKEELTLGADSTLYAQVTSRCNISFEQNEQRPHSRQANDWHGYKPVMPKKGRSGRHAFGKALSRSASLLKKSTTWREMRTGCRQHQQSQRSPPPGRTHRRQPPRRPPSLHWGSRSKANKWRGYFAMGHSCARLSRKALARARGANAS